MKTRVATRSSPCSALLLRWLLVTLLAAPAAISRDAPQITYRLSWTQPTTHYFEVAMRVAPVASDSLRLAIPAWRPGRYIFQDFAARIVAVTATDDAGTALLVDKVDMYTWRVGGVRDRAVTARYRYFADELDAGHSYVDDHLAWINPITLLLYRPGHENAPVTLELSVPDGWMVDGAVPAALAEGLPTHIQAGSYHDLADMPIVAAPHLNRLPLPVTGADVALVWHGDADVDGERAAADLSRIIAEQRAVFGHLPLKRFRFLTVFRDTPVGHGVEHRHGTRLVFGPGDLREEPILRQFLMLCGHEFFHLWSVERIRPAPLIRPDYSRPAYTRTMWFYEGVTSYYTLLCMTRAGLIPPSAFLAGMGSAMNSVEATPGRRVTSVAMASWNAWAKAGKYPPHTGISFYTKGMVLGMLLDLELRRATDGQAGLDDLMRALFDTWGEGREGVPEDGIRTLAERIAGRSLDGFFDAYVDGTADIAYAPYLAVVGLERIPFAPLEALPPVMGMTVEDLGEEGVAITAIRPASPAERAALQVGDRIDSVAGRRPSGSDIDSLVEDRSPGDAIMVTIRRRGNRLDRPLVLAPPDHQAMLLTRMTDRTAAQERRYADWLDTRRTDPAAAP